MSNPVFPPSLAAKQDSSYYRLELEDVALRTDIAGGYVVTRAKHTRRPRRTFTTGFTSMYEADRQTLQSFWNTVKGGVLIFDWTDPPTGEVVQVRFLGGEPLPFKYTGAGILKQWDITFKLEEV